MIKIKPIEPLPHLIDYELRLRQLQGLRAMSMDEMAQRQLSETYRPLGEYWGGLGVCQGHNQCPYCGRRL